MKQPDKVLLSVVLTVFNLLCLRIMLITSGLWQTTFLRYLPLPFDLAIQPLIFLYIASLTLPEFQLQKKHLLHFIPFALSFIYSLIVYLSILPHTMVAEKDAIANHFLFNQVKEGEDFLSVCTAIIYWFCSLKLIRRYRRWLYNSTSNTLFPTYAWLRNIIILFAIFFFTLTLAILLEYTVNFGVNHFLHWQIIFIYLSFLVYYLGFKGYHIPANQLSLLPVKEEPAFSSNEQDEIPTADTEAEASDPKYKAISESILKLLSEEKLFLDPELSLQTLAKKLNLNPTLVSAAINIELQKNFRNLINEYRVEEVKERLKTSRSKQFSLLGVAYECGFNSEASFYRIFKNTAGVSPKEYLKQLQEA